MVATLSVIIFITSFLINHIMDIKYRLEAIAETEFKMNYDFDYSEFVPEKIQLQVGHDIKPNMGENTVAIKAKASYVYGDGETLLATNTVLMTFGLLPIQDIIVMKDDGTFTAQNPIVIDTFLMATIGALRGIFMKNLKGTPLEQFYLPLIPLEYFRPK